MSFIDIIYKLLHNNKKNTKIIAYDLNKTKGETTPLEIALYNDKTPLTDKEITIEINEKTYTRRTNNDGIAKININLQVGKYRAFISFEGDDDYNSNTEYCNININPVLTTNDLRLTYKDGGKFKVNLKDNNMNPLVNAPVYFIINHAKYKRTTDNNGEVALSINLPPATYDIKTCSGNISKLNKIQVDKRQTRMEGTDINMTEGDGTIYQCAIYSGEYRVNSKVDITINGKTYTRTADSNGLYKLNINLKPGEYKVSSKFAGDDYHFGSYVENIIKVKEQPKPEPTPAPSKLYPYITTPGGGKLGQTNGSRCGPHSLMQCIYRLTGIELSEATLANVCGTTSSGTSHSGLETGLAWFNRNYGYNLKMKWVNLSDIGWDGLQKAINNGAVFIHLLYRNQWGHYEVSKTTDLVILNSLGSYCNYPAYCGYLENRSRSTQQSYISGISQKSICIITL